MAPPSGAEIRALSPDERIRLIELLWDTFVDDPSALPVTDAQRAELRGRACSKPNEARPWSEVLGELERD